MKYYKYDEFGFDAGYREAQANPEKKGKFLGCGKNETAKKTKAAPSGKVNYWNGSKWSLVGNNRFKQIWNTANPGQSNFVGADNVIPENWTLLEYIPFHKWNGSVWVLDPVQKTKHKRTEKLKVKHAKALSRLGWLKVLKDTDLDADDRKEINQKLTQ